LKKILVLCTGNSCRSIIAEGLINHLANGKYEAVSAGSHPAGYVHPKSIEVLKKHGIEMEEARSKSWDEFANDTFNLVITVCDEAADETCPAFPGDFKKLHWSTPDPAKAAGTETAIHSAFDGAYKLLKKHIENELL
jgi:arsenate reductase